MSWMKTTACPVCGAEGFDPDCDEVDVEVGTIEGNLRGRCPVCGEVFEDRETGRWVAEIPERPGPVRPEVVEEMNRLGRAIDSALLAGVGFALLVFDFGEDGFMNYLSNADRRSMLGALREFVRKFGAAVEVAESEVSDETRGRGVPPN